MLMKEVVWEIESYPNILVIHSEVGKAEFEVLAIESHVHRCENQR